MSETVSEQDLLAVFRYLDGQLEENDAIAFELRLSSEERLAEVFRQAQGMEGLLRARPRAPKKSIPRRRWAAAAVLLVLAGLWASRLVDGRVVDSVAILPSDSGFLEYQQRQGMKTLVPELSRAEGEDRAGSERGLLLEALRRSVTEQTSHALREQTRQATGGYYRIAITTTANAHALLLTVDERGQIERVLPKPEDSRTSIVTRAETVNYLPAAPVAGNTEAGEDLFDPGLLVPWGTRQLEVVLALKAEPVGGQLLGNVDAEAASVSSVADSQQKALTELVAWLREAGFEVELMSVRAE